MANQVNFTNYGTQNLVATTSRYSAKQIIYYGAQQRVTFAIYRKKNFTFAATDKFYEITKSMEFRPDLVSHSIYGIPDYWWRIMETNNMKDVMEFRAGRTIRLPGGYLM